ncbi:Uncharacterized protein APZ42_023312 [Daphnia magna]|uniref:Uncharacterized protein n=1 Tax=Daphnia magna TaxID=35525 RepID=A0A164V269_9CRUS|nr:Uncharacterized protein APZ42_023312 [Daphnia magna]
MTLRSYDRETLSRGVRKMKKNNNKKPNTT